MNTSPLSQSVDTFAKLTHTFTEHDLNNEGWQWQAYKQVRYAHLTTALDLRQLATDILAQRTKQGQPPTLAQQILARHHAAYRDILTLYLGLNESELSQEPAPDEWSLRQILAHVNLVEQHFYQGILHALNEHRQDISEPTHMPEEATAHLWLDKTQAIFQGKISDSLAYYDKIHTEVLSALASLTNTDLTVPTFWWEEIQYPVRFRMHRFEIHLREHTNQVEKTLIAIDRTPNESKRLIRQIYGALADVEGVMIGAGEAYTTESLTLAETIRERAENVAEFVNARR